MTTGITLILKTVGNIVCTRPLIYGWVMDFLFGDPSRLPHPVVGFGKIIAKGERLLNKGSHRKTKGAVMSILLVILVFAVVAGIIALVGKIHPLVAILIEAELVIGGTLFIGSHETALAVQYTIDDFHA